MEFDPWTILTLILGVATHIVKKVVERRKTNETFNMKDWLTKYPYRTVLTLMAGVGGYLGLMAAGELSYASAFLTGYAANSLGGAAE
jgi:hypothetical protein